jgi:hypothetical protein
MAVTGSDEWISIEQAAEMGGSVAGGPSPRGLGLTVVGRCSDRKWPIIMMIVTLVSGMAFMLWWPILVDHGHYWDTGGDLWGIFRAAHYIGWGFLGGVYDSSTGVNSLPGLEVLLAPVAMLSGHLGLTESFPPTFLHHPTAALLLEPIELLLASTVLFAVDALAEHLVVSKGRRVTLCIAVAVLAWPTVAIWGHAEDCLALTLAVYAFIAGLKGSWKACGWLFGFALVTQPFVVMVLPLVVAWSPAGQRTWMAIRSVLLSAVLVVVALASNAANTYRALVLQPTPPSVNHATPWASLSPRVPDLVPATGSSATVSVRAGKFVEETTAAHHHVAILVSGGAGRAVELVLALLVGLYVWRRPQPPDRLIWLAAACLGMRCLFEAVMTPYYLGAPFILAIAIASRQGNKRFWATSVIAIETTVFAYHHLSPWVWWLPVVAGTAAILALGFPNKPRITSELPLIQESRAETPTDRPFQLVS